MGDYATTFKKASGIKIEVEEGKGEDNEWKFNQKLNGAYPQPTEPNVKSIDWTYGPTRVEGHVDTDTFDIKLWIQLAGIALGEVTSNLKGRTSVKVDLQYYKGDYFFYLKEGNEVWVRTSMKVTYNGTFQMERKILQF